MKWIRGMKPSALAIGSLELLAVRIKYIQVITLRSSNCCTADPTYYASSGSTLEHLVLSISAS